MQAEAFKAWRERTGYTQAAAAARFFKVARATVQNWESGATPIPAAVEAACDVWGRRVKQEDARLGPVILFYSDGPMFRNPYGPQQRVSMLQQEQYATNAEAIARACELWGREGVHNPFIMGSGGETLWNAPEIAQVAGGSDTGAPTRPNLLKRCASVIKALADDARENISMTAGSGPAMPTASQRADRERRITELAAELDGLAESMLQDVITHHQVADRLVGLRKLGKRPSDSLVSDLARDFAALEAQSRPGGQGRAVRS